MTRPSVRSLAILSAVAALCAGCSRLRVAWEPGKTEIGVTVEGPPGASLVVLAGPPTGPHFMPDVPEVWSTVGPGGIGGFEVARAELDASGSARARIPISALPATPTLLQAVAISKDAPIRPVGVSECVAARSKDGTVAIRAHWIEALLGTAAWVSLLAVVVVAAAWCLGRRVKVPAAPRWSRLGLVVAFAATLVGVRWAHGARELSQAHHSRPPPLLPPPSNQAFAASDPLDRVTLPGFHELIRNTRDRVADAALVRIVVPRDSARREYLAAQAAWLLWPRKTKLVAEPETTADAGTTYLSLDGRPPERAAEVLFQNSSGSLWREKP